MASRPAWSADSRTIFYTDRDGSGVTDVHVLALETASGRTIELTSVAALNHAEQVRTTSDPDFVLASIAQPNWSLQLNLYSISTSSGDVRTIATNLGTPWFVTSRDGGTAAYQGGRYDADTIYVVSTIDPSDRTRIPSAGARPRVISLSPDGSTLLYSTDGLHLTRTDGSEPSTPISLSSSDLPAAMASHVIWSGEAPQLLIAERTAQAADSAAVQTLDARSGERILLATLPLPVGSVERWQLARSDDGRSYAVWAPISVVSENVERTTFRYRLYLKEPDDIAPQAALEFTAHEPLRWFEFSPDGRQLALILQGRLYLVQVKQPE